MKCDLRSLALSSFWSELILEFNEVSDVNKCFYELKQCQKGNWVQEKDRVNRSFRGAQNKLAIVNTKCPPHSEVHCMNCRHKNHDDHYLDII